MIWTTLTKSLISVVLLGSVASGSYGFMKLTQEELLPNKNVVYSGDKDSGSSSISTDHSFLEQQNGEAGANSSNSSSSIEDREQLEGGGRRENSRPSRNSG